MGTDAIFEELKANLKNRFLFYIPSGAFKSSGIEEQAKAFDLIMDQLIIVLPNGDIKSEDYSTHILEILEKPTNLKHNLFKLLDCKANLTPPQFEFLLGQYENTLNFYTFVSYWMNEHLQEYWPEMEKGLPFYLEFQADTFKGHTEALNDQFPKFQLNIDAIKRFGKKVENLSKEDPVAKTENTAFAKPSKEMTNEEIDAYLLQTVFNIDKRHF